MRRYLTTTGLTAGLLLGGAVSASAAILDFTVDGSILTGTYKGIGYTVTGVPVDPNQDQNFDGNAATVLAPLALENDGVGISDDEITFSQKVTITFDSAVTLRGAYFLDLFASQIDPDAEAPIINGGASYTLTPLEVFGNNRSGYAQATLDTWIKGTVFTFESAGGNDNQGDPDYALAALDIAPIPLPAGVLLLGTALAGLGFARRRKA